MATAHVAPFASPTAGRHTIRRSKSNDEEFFGSSSWNNSHTIQGTGSPTKKTSSSSNLSSFRPPPSPRDTKPRYSTPTRPPASGSPSPTFQKTGPIRAHSAGNLEYRKTPDENKSKPISNSKKNKLREWAKKDTTKRVLESSFSNLSDHSLGSPANGRESPLPSRVLPKKPSSESLSTMKLRPTESKLKQPDNLCLLQTRSEEFRTSNSSEEFDRAPPQKSLSNSSRDSPLQKPRRRSNDCEIYHPPEYEIALQQQQKPKKKPHPNLAANKPPSIPRRHRSNDSNIPILPKKSPRRHKSNDSTIPIIPKPMRSPRKHRSTDSAIPILPKKETTDAKSSPRMKRQGSLKHFFGRSSSTNELNTTFHSEKAVAPPSPRQPHGNATWSSPTKTAERPSLSKKGRAGSLRHLLKKPVGGGSSSKKDVEEQDEAAAPPSPHLASSPSTPKQVKGERPSLNKKGRAGSLRHLLKRPGSSSRRDVEEPDVAAPPSSRELTVESSHGETNDDKAEETKNAKKERPTMTKKRSGSLRHLLPGVGSSSKSLSSKISKDTTSTSSKALAVQSDHGVGPTHLEGDQKLDQNTPKAASDGTTKSGRPPRVFRTRSGSSKNLVSASMSNLDYDNSSMGKKKTKRFQQLLKKRAAPTRTKSNDLELMKSPRKMSHQRPSTSTRCSPQKSKKPTIPTSIKKNNFMARGSRSLDDIQFHDIDDDEADDDSIISMELDVPNDSSKTQHRPRESMQNSWEARGRTKSQRRGGVTQLLSNDDDDDDDSISLDLAFNGGDSDGNTKTKSSSLSRLVEGNKNLPPPSPRRPKNTDDDSDDISISLQPEKPNSGGIMAGLWNSFRSDQSNEQIVDKDDDLDDDESIDINFSSPKKSATTTMKPQSASMPELDFTSELVMSPEKETRGKGPKKQTRRSQKDADNGSLASDESSENGKPSSGIIAGLWNSFSSFGSLDDDDQENEHVRGWNSQTKGLNSSLSSVDKKKQATPTMSPVVIQKAAAKAGGLLTGFIDKVYDSLMDDGDESSEEEMAMTRLDKRINKLAGLQ